MMGTGCTAPERYEKKAIFRRKGRTTFRKVGYPNACSYDSLHEFADSPHPPGIGFGGGTLFMRGGQNFHARPTGIRASARIRGCPGKDESSAACNGKGKPRRCAFIPHFGHSRRSARISRRSSGRRRPGPQKMNKQLRSPPRNRFNHQARPKPSRPWFRSMIAAILRRLCGFWKMPKNPFISAYIRFAFISSIPEATRTSWWTA